MLKPPINSIRNYFGTRAEIQPIRDRNSEYTPVLGKLKIPIGKEKRSQGEKKKKKKKKKNKSSFKNDT